MSGVRGASSRLCRVAPGDNRYGVERAGMRADMVYRSRNAAAECGERAARGEHTAEWRCRVSIGE